MSAYSALRPPPLTVLAAARGALAVTALLMPRTGARLFRMDAERTPAIAMARMFGIRNAALAAGLMRLDTINAPHGFVLINIIVDLVDALALLAARRRREIGTTASVLGGGIALCATVVGVAGLASLPEAGAGG
jgi:hypothetical protein